MPNLYARQTALTNVGGRIDYISNPKRQEHLLAVFDGAADHVDGAYWRRLAQECKAASKHATPGHSGVQGRELVIQLSNSLLQRLSAEEIAEKLARSFEERYGRPCMVAVHFNKDMTNLHAHLIYSERDLLKEPVEKVAPRALFFDEAGKRHYKKGEILDEAGELRPGCRIVAKGEIYERRYFGAVDQTFSHKAWLRTAKSEWLLPLRNGELRGDVEITEYDPSSGKLAQQHVGNKVYNEKRGTTRAQIEEYNRQVKAYNSKIDSGLVPDDVAQDLLLRMRLQEEKNKMLRRLNEFLDRWWFLEQKARQALQHKNAGALDARISAARFRSDKEVEARMQTLNAPLNWRLQTDLDEMMGTNFADQDKARYFARKREQGKEGR